MVISSAAGSPGEDEALRLRALLLQAAPSTTSDIVSACNAIEAVSRQLPRAFFRLCFPLLLRKIFGFEDLHSATSAPVTASGGWLSLVSQPGNEASADALIGLLAPGGSLFGSLLAADSENAVRYVFPTERLPEWVRRLLTFEKGAAILDQVSILFKNRLKEDGLGNMQLELDIFQYYFFWFAYYAVCKDTSPAAEPKKIRTTPSRSSQLRSQIENWASSISGLNHAIQQGTLVSPLHPYLQLLHLYLSHFVGPYVAARKGANSNLTLWQTDSIPHSDIVVRTLIDFWLVDDDPCPLPTYLVQQFQLHMLPLSLPPLVSSYVPPSNDLTNAVRFMISYFTSILHAHLSNHYPPPEVYGRRSTATSSQSLSISYVQSLQRPLYRYLLRAFCMWPVGSSVSKVAALVDVWVSYAEPWSAAAAAVLAETESRKNEMTTLITTMMTSSPPPLSYTAQWQGYVLSNYPFYASMVLHFLEFALKFIYVDMEAIFQATCRVIGTVVASKELLDTLKMVDAAYCDLSAGRYRHPYTGNPFSEVAPFIYEQLQDWEEGILGNIEQEFRWNDRKLPVYTGVHQMLQALIVQAEAEMQASTVTIASMAVNEVMKQPMNSQTLQTLKEMTSKLMEDDDDTFAMGSLLSPTATATEAATVNGSEETVTATVEGLQRHSWADVRYRGDWMRRPIESCEIGWLVRLLVGLSDELNCRLGLSGSVITGRDTGRDIGREVIGLKEILRIIKKELRKRGLRINLRFIASKQLLCSMVLVLFVYWVFVKMYTYMLYVIYG